MNSTAEKIKIMQAHEQGAVIQISSVYKDSWEDCCENKPGWDWVSFKYRVRLREPREFIVYVDKLGELAARWKNGCGMGFREEVHVVEQLEKQK